MRGGHRPGAGRKKGRPNKASESRQREVAASGIVPLDVMLGAMRQAWDSSDYESAARIAKDAAPYCHPRLSAVEHTGPNGNPLVPEANPRDVARAVLDILRGARIEGRVEDDAEPAKEPKIDELALRGSSTTAAGGISTIPPAAEVSPGAPKRAPAQLQPGEREVRDNGAVITFDADVGRYSITDASGRARGYRPTLEIALQMADAFPSQRTERKPSSDNRAPRNAPGIPDDAAAAVEQAARRAPRVVRRPAN